LPVRSQQQHKMMQAICNGDMEPPSGMTKEQVRFVLGTPLMTDIFHAERWDYVYTRVPERGGPMEQRRLAVFFDGGKLARLDGDVIPQAASASASGSTP